MSQIIAVEPELTNVKDFLSDKGFRVENISFDKEFSRQMDKYDAFIVTGQRTNFMGINDTNTKAVVIDAAGLSAEQVYHELQLRLD